VIADLAGCVSAIFCGCRYPRTSHGLWLIHDDQEYFLPYDQFPWFQEAPVKHVFNVEEPHSGHLYWPDLDVDLSLDIIQYPERFPLQFSLNPFL
jgi:hypothetical protein